ncbi:MAG: DUF523 domain-containing protein [Oceanobacter sp.]
MKLLVSACLLGEPVRYDGLDNKQKLTPDQQELLWQWREQGRLVAVCPESLGGLPTPRPPAEIQNATGSEVLKNQAQVITISNQNVTEAFKKGAQRTLEIALQHQIRHALLAARSPSCGSTEIYDGTFSKKRIAGAGVTAALLTQHNIECFEPAEFERLKKLMRTS